MISESESSLPCHAIEILDELHLLCTIKPSSVISKTKIDDCAVLSRSFEAGGPLLVVTWLILDAQTNTAEFAAGEWDVVKRCFEVESEQKGTASRTTRGTTAMVRVGVPERRLHELILLSLVGFDDTLLHSRMLSFSPAGYDPS